MDRLAGKAGKSDVKIGPRKSYADLLDTLSRDPTVSRVLFPKKPESIITRSFMIRVMDVPREPTSIPIVLAGVATAPPAAVDEGKTLEAAVPAPVLPEPIRAVSNKANKEKKGLRTVGVATLGYDEIIRRAGEAAEERKQNSSPVPRK